MPRKNKIPKRLPDKVDLSGYIPDKNIEIWHDRVEKPETNSIQKINLIIERRKRVLNIK